MKKFFIFFAFIIFSQNIFSQTTQNSTPSDNTIVVDNAKIMDIVIHKVEIGETIMMICKKYLIKPEIIYSANRFIIDGINQGMVLQIPVERKLGQDFALKQNRHKREEKIRRIAFNSNVRKNNLGTEDFSGSGEETEEGLEYTIQPKETLFSISKKYNVEMEKIIEKNEEALKKGFVAGTVILIPLDDVGIHTSVAETKVDDKKPNTTIETEPKIEPKENIAKTDDSDKDKIQNGYTIHKVQPNETLYSLSKRYFTTIADITASNENIQNSGLQVGFTIRIPVTKIGDDVVTNIATENKKNIPVIEKPARTENKTDTIHKVLPNETLTMLSNKYSVSIYDIRSSNANILEKGLQPGQNIKIPKSKPIETKSNTIAGKDGLKSDTKVNKKSTAMDKATNKEVFVVGDIITTIQQDETLEEIAKKYDVTVEDIIKNNKLLLKKNKIKAGLVIRVPAPQGSLEFTPETFENTDENE